MMGGIGEAMLFAALLLFGTISLAALVTSQLLNAGGDTLSTWTLGLGVAVSVTCVLIGGGGILSTALQLRTSVERRSALANEAATRVELLGTTPATEREYPCIPRDADLTNSPGVRLAYRLPIAASPNSQFFYLSGFWLAAVGLASTLVVWALEGFQVVPREAYRGLVAFPFAIIAITTTYFFVKSLLVQITLGPTTVEVSDHPLFPTKSYRVFVSQAGHLSASGLQLRLVCQEEVTYEQGTNVRTESQVVCSQQLFRKEDVEINPGDPFEHECEFEVPEEAMHTFQSASNRIHWKLVVRGNVQGWPDFERSFSVVVYPCNSNSTENN